MRRRRSPIIRDRVQSKSEQLSTKAQALLNKIPKDGRSVTNQSLRYSLRRSGVSYDDYYKYRKELLEAGKIALGRGRGGTVHRILEIPEEVGKPSREYEIYEDVKKWLEDDENRNIQDESRKATVFSAVTASPTGYRRKSGLWSRPDIVLVIFDEYPRLLQRTNMTVKSYEVKRVNSYDITAVYEAASHQKGAHFSYLVITLPGMQGATDPPPPEVAPLLERFGVGFAWFYKTGKGTYDMNIVLEAERQNPDPFDQNEIVNNFYEKLTQKVKNLFDKFIGR